MKEYRRNMSKSSKVLWTIILVPFLIVVFPGVLFFQDMTEPRIFGFPFIYGFVMICWLVQTVAIAVATATNWGEKKPKRKKGGSDPTEA